MRSLTLIATFLTLGLVQGATISKNARCGSKYGGNTCLGSSFGSCCSQYNFCGSSSDYCAPRNGCQSKYGSCDAVAPKSSSTTKLSSSSTATVRASPSASPAQKVSKNARCGAGFGGQTCKGSEWGNCCSQYFYVGFPSLRDTTLPRHPANDHSVEVLKRTAVLHRARRAMEIVRKSLRLLVS